MTHAVRSSTFVGILSCMMVQSIDESIKESSLANFQLFGYCMICTFHDLFCVIVYETSSTCPLS